MASTERSTKVTFPKGGHRPGARPAGGHWLGGWEEWGAVLALTLMLLVVAWSVTGAKWISPQPSLVLILFLAVATGIVLSRSRLGGASAHSLMVVIGVWVVLWQAASLQPDPGMTEKFGHLVSELGLWWGALATGEPSSGTAQVALVLGLLTWLLGYVSVWFVLRRRNPWVPVLLGTAGFLANQMNLAEPDYGLFLLFLVAALFLLAQTNSISQRLWFGRQPVRYGRWGMKYFLPSVLGVAIVTLSLSWLIPQVRVVSLETLVKTQMPWRNDVDGYLRDFFAAVPPQRSGSGGSGTISDQEPLFERYSEQVLYRSDDSGMLRFPGPIDSSDRVLFFVKAEEAGYWWTQKYDVYTPDGWLASPVLKENLEPKASFSQGEESGSGTELTYTVIPQVETDVLLGAGELVSANIPITVKTLAPFVFEIDLTDSSGDALLPPDIAYVAANLRANLPDNPAQLAERLPESLTLVDTYYEKKQIIGISVVRSQQTGEDLAAIRSERPPSPGKGYTIVALVPQPTADQLGRAGRNYPQRITDRYLQLPPDFPESVRQLARDLTKSSPTPYDKVVAIGQFLYEIPYSEAAPAPPSGVDGVEHFLFTQKAGSCVYFASAMTVMLRSVGLPSRLSIGYAGSPWDEEQEAYAVREMDYHAWPEVYFPGYGWIQFEGTPGRGLGGSGSIFSVPPAQPGGEEQTSPEVPVTEDLPTPVAEPVEDWPVPETDLGESGSEDLGSVEEDVNTVTGDEEVAPVGATAAGWAWLALGIIFALLMVGLVSYRRVASIIGLSTASAAYARMCLLASLVGLGPEPQQTTLEYSTRLSAAFPHQAGAIADIAQTYVVSQYSRNKALTVDQKQELDKLWHQVRHALLLRVLHIKNR